MNWTEIIRAFRRLRRTPRFTVTVIASIAISVGPILVAFSVFEAAFLRGMAARNPELLLTVRTHRKASRDRSTSVRGVSFPDYRDLQAALPRTAWRHITAWTLRDVSRASQRGDQPVRIAATTGDYFRIANAHFVRGYAPAEQEIGVVVTRALWRELTADRGAPELVIFGQRYGIVGVVEDSFRGLYSDEGVDAWLPLAALPRLESDPNILSYRELEDLFVVIQPTEKRQADSFQPYVTAVSTGLADFHDGGRYGWRLAVTRAQPGFVELLRTQRGQLALVPLLVLVSVLLIAATNVASLFVVRAAGRERELQLRLALGIRRRLLILYVCLEAIALGIAGLVFGLWSGSLALQRLIGHPALARLDLRLRAVSVLAACGAAVLFVAMCTVMPALRVGRMREADILHQGEGIATYGVSRLQRSYLVLQFTLALAFTCVALQLASAVHQQNAVNVGFDTRNLLVIADPIGMPNRTSEQRLNDYYRVTHAISSIRGVASVSASVAEFFGGYRMATRMLTTVPSGAAFSDDGLPAAMDVVGPGYFSTLGLALRAGREFGDEDRLGMPTRIVVNQRLASLVGGANQAIGKTLYESGKYPLEIIGVAPDIRATAAEQVRPVYYRTLNQSPLPSFVLYTRVAAYSPAYRSAITSAVIRELPESAGRIRIQTAEEQRRQRDLPAITVFWLSTTLAGLAMLITGLGLYGVASYAAVARKKEYGIRAALGASPRQLATMIFREGIRWTSLAAVLSLPFVWLGMKVTTAVVVGVRHMPLLTTVTILAIYLVVVFLALTLPARRAALVSPSDALRSL